MGRRLVLGVLALVPVVVAACASGDDDTAEGGATAEEAEVDRPAGPAAEITGPLTGGQGINLATPVSGPSLEEAGWVEEEYRASGTATSYRAEGELPA
ncbi:MAG TPA: alpha/beta hydrolase domain-containing protein, partial [Acidimicrobiales bacterium]|nr:alpha/beta hydrolase domain-containing protein [Acidimicrobiales bacterium]